MPRLVRTTIALDEESANILEKLAKEMGASYSTLVRLALKFFPQHGGSAKDLENMKLWSSLLSKGEHIILDIDHWLLFLRYIESFEKKESFYSEGKKIAKSHAEQLAKITPTPEEYLKRLEACNFYRLSKDSEDEYTLVLNSDLAKRFVKELISETLTEMGFNLDIKEDLMKLRVKITGRKIK
jgi:hypothetical protein